MRTHFAAFASFPATEISLDSALLFGLTVRLWPNYVEAESGGSMPGRRLRGFRVASTASRGSLVASRFHQVYQSIR